MATPAVGYAAPAAKAPLEPFSFERRAPHENDVAIKIAYCQPFQTRHRLLFSSSFPYSVFASLRMSLEDPTVELILREEWRKEGITVRQIGTMLVTWKVLAEDQVATFLGRVDVHGARAEGWKFWRGHVINKFLKFVGSEYAVRCFPDRDTSHVTNVVRLFIQEETLLGKVVELLPNVMGSPLMTPQTATAVFRTTLFLLILYANSLRPAVIFVLHIFRDIRLTHECFATKVPQLLNFFRPGQSWQGTTTEDRLEVIFHELQVRGYEVEMSIRTHVTAGPSDDVRVQFHDITRNTRAISFVRVVWQRPDKTFFEREVTPSELYGLIIEECVLYRENFVNNVRVGAKRATKELNGAQLHTLSNLIKKILRLKNKDVLRRDAAYNEILQSEGWIPLSILKRYVEDDLAAHQQTLPAWMENVEEDFFLSHDNYRRFELGICEVNGSQYNKRRCARALYGHDLDPSQRSLDIISSLPRVSLTDLSEVPQFGWIAVDKSAWMRLKSIEPGLALFDAILFTPIYPAEAIGAFRRYREYTRAERQLDEKLHGTKALRFMELYLHALVLDHNVRVYRRESTEAAHQRCWYAAPNYTVNPETRTVRPAGEKDQYTPFRVLPKIFFTGRQVTMTLTPSEEPNELMCNERVLESGDDSVGTGIPRRGTSREFALPATNIVSPGDDVRHTDWYLGVSGVPVTVLPAAWRWTAARHYSAAGPFPDGFPFARMMETLADVFASYHAIDQRLQSPLPEEEAVHSVTQLHPSRPTVGSKKELNLTPLRQEVEEFLKDGERFSMQLHVPVSREDSSPLFNRSRLLKELKVWIVQQGLTYKQLSCAQAQEKDSDSEGAAANRAPLITTLELWKPFRWSERELTAVIRELGLEGEHKFVTEQLKLGLTRHCENKINNYEILEFLGDAVMDFIVPLDAFLSIRLIPMTARQLILHLPPAGGDSDRDPPCLEALFLNVGETINSSLCCNKVIACLLPPTVSAHFDRLYGANICEKSKADVFESILGAVYKTLGMEAVRQLMTRLFSGLREVYVRVAKENSQVQAAVVALFKAAIENCPYLFDSTGAVARKFPLHFCGFDTVLVERYVTCTDECSLRAHSSHTSSQPFPRIQDKDYATHFTTGSVYSYRRIRSMDTVRLFHRIAAIFAKTSGTAFTNEVITPTTHLVVDFDSANIRSWGGLDLLHQWSRKALGSAVCTVLLDCSGHSKAKKKLLNSYHIHFPQVVVGLRELERLLLDLRNFFYESVEKQRLRHQDSTAALQHVTVLMTASFVQSQLTHWRLQPQRHHWTYCTFDDLRTLSGACPVLRFAALEHIGELIMAQDVEMFSRVFGVTDESRCLCTVLEDVAVVEDSVGHRWMLPQSWLIPKGNGVKVKLDFPEEKLWEDVVDTSIVQSQKLRMYLCDKYDRVTLSECRPLYAEAMMLPRSDGNIEEVRIARPNSLSTTTDKMRRCEGRMMRHNTMIECWASSSLPSSGDDKDDTAGPIEAWTFDELAFHDYAVVMPHLLLLRLTSLRTPTHFDTDALEYDVWRHHSEGGDAEVRGSGVTLPTYADVVGQRWPVSDSAPQCDSWTVWLNTFEISDAKGKPQACSPAWWAYNQTNKVATFYVASLPIYRVDGYSSLVEALESQGGNGMKTIARFFIPHVQCTENPTIEKWTSANPDIFPFFVKPTSKLQKVRQLFPLPPPVATGPDVFPTGLLRVRCMNPPEDPEVYRHVEALAQWWWLAIWGVLRLSLCDNPVLVLAEDEALCKALHQAWRGHPLRRGLASPPIWALDTVASRLGQSQLPGGGTLPKGTFYFPLVFVTHRDAASCAKILPAAKKSMMAGLAASTVTWYVASAELEDALRRHTS